MSTMLNNEELLMYFGCLQEKRNISEVAEALFPDKANSVRVSISNKDADEKLMEKGYLEARKNGSWKFKSNEEKLGEIIAQLLSYEGSDEGFPTFEDASEEEDKLREMFQDEGMFRFFRTEYLSSIMGEKVSKTTPKLSFYLKAITLIIGSNRVLIKRLNDREKGPLTISLEQLNTIRGGLEMLFSMFPDELANLKTVFEILEELAPGINITSLPPLESQDPIVEQADSLERILEWLEEQNRISTREEFFTTPTKTFNQTELSPS